ncbi:MAG TPA: type VI secretion system baseplate subunit TssE [Stellaceae bacterium]|nr:type VI secretion system baseplate subunit TssE [Stellaceae bacterium]
MGEPRLVPGAPAPLFERLTDLDPASSAEGQPLRMLSPEALRQSVARELDRLLNTRAPVAADILAKRERSTIDYGIPDLSLFAPRDFDGETGLMAMVREAIEVFEPRLAHPRVRIERPAGERGALVVHVEGGLRLGAMIEPISFAVSVHRGGGHYGE